MPNPNEVDLTFVVNGQPITVKANGNAPIKTAAHRALEQSGNTGQSLENWELRNAAGQILDLQKKIEDFNFPPGTPLFLNLKAGVGG